MNELSGFRKWFHLISGGTFFAVGVISLAAAPFTSILFLGFAFINIPIGWYIFSVGLHGYGSTKSRVPSGLINLTKIYTLLLTLLFIVWIAFLLVFERFDSLKELLSVVGFGIISIGVWGAVAFMLVVLPIFGLYKLSLSSRD